MAVDPFNLPGAMKRADLEWWILFGICVAGKGAKQTEAKLRAFLQDWQVPSNPKLTNCTISTPFSIVRDMVNTGALGSQLRYWKLGKYKLLEKAFPAAIKLDVTALSLDTLERVPGIGPKTARMILLYSRPNYDCVPLDTHILKWLRSKGYDAPKSTPGSKKKYRELEEAFRAEAKKLGKTVRQLDTEVWQSYASRPGYTDRYKKQ